MADAVGLSNVHVNRNLHVLREMELISVRDKGVAVNEFERLMEYRWIKPEYLYLEKHHTTAYDIN